MVLPNIINPSELLYAPDRALRLITSLETWVARATHALYAYEGHDLVEMDARIQGYLSRLRVDEER